MSDNIIRTQRLNIAVQLCIAHPEIYRKFHLRAPIYSSTEAKLCGDILREISRHEPLVLHTIEYYRQREQL